VSEVRLSAEPRTEFGKGGARRTRRAGKIPAVIYGHGADPRHVSLPAREFANAVRHGGANVLLTLDFGGEEQLAIPKSIQRHALKGTFDHVDLLAVRQGEKVSVDVPVTVVGEVAAGALAALESATISVEAEATNLPTGVEVSVEGVEAGTTITAGAVSLPSGSTLVSDPESIVVSVQVAPTAEDLAADTEEAAEVPAAADADEDTTADEAAAAGQTGPTE
jgi:large subunit ribosomal protein L25